MPLRTALQRIADIPGVGTRVTQDDERHSWNSRWQDQDPSPWFGDYLLKVYGGRVEVLARCELQGSPRTRPSC